MVDFIVNLLSFWLILFILILSALVGIHANLRGRSGLLWFIISIVISPVLAVAVLAHLEWLPKIVPVTPPYRKSEAVVGEKKTPENDQKFANACRITYCEQDGNAFKSGIRVGDLLISIDGTQVFVKEDIPRAFSNATSASLLVLIFRGTEPLWFSVPVGKLGISVSHIKLTGYLYDMRGSYI